MTQLVEMGFTREHVLMALRSTETNRVEVAMEYLLTHPAPPPGEALFGVCVRLFFFFVCFREALFWCCRRRSSSCCCRVAWDGMGWMDGWCAGLRMELLVVSGGRSVMLRMFRLLLHLIHSSFVGLD